MSPHATSDLNGPSELSPSIPIVDLSHFTPDSPPSVRQKIAQDLVDACQTVGFVYIRGHGVPDAELHRAFAISKAFYDLPTEEKMKAPHPPGFAQHRGYSPPGFENVTGVLSEGDEKKDQETIRKMRQVQDVKESYEVGSEENDEQANIWPLDQGFPLPEFRPFMTQFYWTCFEAAKKILRALALGLGLEDEDYLLKFHSGHRNQLRLLHYPPIPAVLIEEGKAARMPAHTDYSSMTLLFQDDVGGLQVEDPRRPGEFMDATPIEGTLVFNIGDLLMRWSNDRLISTKHRVTLPPMQDRFTGNDRMTRARYSIPYFLTTEPDLLIECLPACVDEAHPAKYEPITRRDYATMRAKMDY